MTLTYGSLFTGIGGFDLGFDEADLQCAWQVEIDPACQSVLQRHWPDVPRFGDIRAVGAQNLPPVNIICGGFPCQGLSVAGNRAGLADERSGLFFEMLRVIYELQPVYAIWENVPGLLSSCSCRRCRRRCARCGEIAGADDETCDVCGHTKFSGRVLPDHRGADFFTVVSSFGFVGYDGAWTLLDAQYFGLAQRRRRLFGVFARRDIGAERCAEILSFPTRMRGDPPPGREAGQGLAATLTERFAGRSNQWPPINEADNLIVSEDGLSRPLLKGGSGGRRLDGDSDTLIAAALNSGGNKGGFRTEPGEHLVAAPLKANSPGRRNGGSSPIPGEFVVARPLAFGETTDHYDESQQTYVVDTRHGGIDENISPTLQSPGKEYAPNAMPLVFDTTQITSPGNYSNPTPGDPCHPLSSSAHPPAISFEWQNGSRSPRTRIIRAGDYAQLRKNSIDAVASPEIGVRRLTPVECERLQGFPGGFTDGQPDTHRYRQLGNAVPVPIARWIGRRLLRIHNQEQA